MNTKYLLTLIFILATLPRTVLAAPIGVELVVNGGAETGDTTGWIEDGIEASLGDNSSQGFGSYAFTAGTGTASGQTLSQIIDLSANAADIDNSILGFIFSVQLQSRSFAGVLDKAIAEVFLKDSSGSILSEYYFEDTINTAIFDWNLFSLSQGIASGTRQIEILLTGTRSGFSSSDGFFDEVSLSLTSKSTSNNVTSASAPAGFVLFAMSIAGIVLGRFRNLKL